MEAWQNRIFNLQKDLYIKERIIFNTKMLPLHSGYIISVRMDRISEIVWKVFLKLFFFAFEYRI